MKLDSKTDLKHLKVDGGMTNGDKVMEILADIGGFDCGLLAGAAVAFVVDVWRGALVLVLFIPGGPLARTWVGWCLP